RMPASLAQATAPSELYPLSLHDALPILAREEAQAAQARVLVVDAAQELRKRGVAVAVVVDGLPEQRDLLGAAGHELLHLLHNGVDRKSTRLNSSHVKISYAVFCLKKKNT